jgi:hypothetical protein
MMTKMRGLRSAGRQASRVMVVKGGVVRALAQNGRQQSCQAVAFYSRRLLRCTEQLTTFVKGAGMQAVHCCSNHRGYVHQGPGVWWLVQVQSQGGGDKLAALFAERHPLQ